MALLQFCEQVLSLHVSDLDLRLDESIVTWAQGFWDRTAAYLQPAAAAVHTTQQGHWTLPPEAATSSTTAASQQVHMQDVDCNFQQHVCHDSMLLLSSAQIAICYIWSVLIHTCIWQARMWFLILFDDDHCIAELQFCLCQDARCAHRCLNFAYTHELAALFLLCAGELTAANSSINNSSISNHVNSTSSSGTAVRVL
jgi:hypothetical protein